MDQLPGLRRFAAVLLLSLAMGVEIVIGEAFFVAHIVVLVEVLGFAGGLAAFAALWAMLGLVVLAVVDLAWPRFGPAVRPFLARLTTSFDALWSRTSGTALVTAFGGIGVSTAAVAAAVWAPETRDWLATHRSEVATMLPTAVVIGGILVVIRRLGRSLINWVRAVASNADPLTRSLGALASMILLGPALSWLLFRLLRYSRRSVYALTLAAGPVFAAVWVPFYGLGVWGLFEELL